MRRGNPNVIKQHLKLRPVWCPTGHGNEDPRGSGSERGSADPQHHAARGPVPMGRQLLLPEDPEKQSQQ
ncbi:hypothetical protein F2P79_001787 [Pimephales promelas]|nr:hypothetical protein F2P79_001787 [Pimephales promelas]